MKLAFWLSAWVLATLPWCNARRFGCAGFWTGAQAQSKFKPLWLICLESALLYGAVFAAMFLVESRQSELSSQKWQFWVIAACLWVVLAFPAAAWFKLRKQ